MSSTTKMAWRSLARNRKRSLVTGSGIALAMAMCMATLGLMDGLSLDLIRGTVDAEVGHVQVHHPAYLESRRVADTLPASDTDLTAARTHTEVLAVGRRLYAWGYMSTERSSAGVQLMGIDPAAEARVTRLHTTLTEGHFVPEQPTPWPRPQQLDAEQQALDRQLTDAAIEAAFADIEAGATAPRSSVSTELSQRSDQIVERLAPKPDRPPAVVLGSKLASNLGVGVGATVHLLYENTLGSQGTLALQVAGITRSGVDAVDRSRVLLHTQDLQNLLLLPGRAHELALRLHDPRRAEAVAAALQAPMEAIAPMKVQAWSSVRPDITALIASNEALMGTLVFIVFVIAGTTVLNTMLVSVMERQREVSVLKALGQAPRRIVAGVLLETLLLAGSACVIGLVLGTLANLYLQRHGIDVSGFGDFSMSGVNLAPVLRSELTLKSALLPLASLLVVSLAAAWIPARMAARIPAATGLRSA